MNWKNYIRGLLVSTLIFGAILMFMTLVLSPGSGMVVVVLYLLTTFFFIMGIAAVLDFFWTKWWNHNEVGFETVKSSLRHGILISGFLISILALRAFRVLNWLDAVVLLSCFVLLEMYFRARN